MALAIENKPWYITRLFTYWKNIPRALYDMGVAVFNKYYMKAIHANMNDGLHIGDECVGDQPEIDVADLTEEELLAEAEADVQAEAEVAEMARAITPAQAAMAHAEEEQRRMFIRTFRTVLLVEHYSRLVRHLVHVNFPADAA